MRLLVTNDDGIDAPGIAALVELAGEFGEPIVAAPAQCWSGCGHRLMTDRPIEVTEIRPRWFRIDAFPADCVRLAVHHLVGPVDVVLAGINDGGNLGADVHVSGTVAAAREAALFRIPSIAISQYRARRGRTLWEDSRELARQALTRALEQREAGVVWNINLPDRRPETLEISDRSWIREISCVECGLDPHPLPWEYRREGDRFVYAGDYQQRARESGTDVDRCFAGAITMTRLRIHAT